MSHRQIGTSTITETDFSTVVSHKDDFRFLVVRSKHELHKNFMVSVR